MDLLVEDSAIPNEDITSTLNDEQERIPLIENGDGTNDFNSSIKFPIKLDTIVDHDEQAEHQLQAHSSSNNDGQSSSLTIPNGNAIVANVANGGSPTKSNISKSNHSSFRGRTSLRSLISRISIISAKPSHLLQDTKRKRDEYLTKNTPKAKLINNWDVDAFAQEMEEGRDSLSQSNHSSAVGEEDTAPEKKFNTTWMTQFYVLLHRSLKNSRSSILTGINITKSVALGILTGLLWFQMPNDEQHVRDRGSFLFFSITYWIFDGTFNAIFSFPMERTIIFKERASGSYHLSAYFLSKTLSEMPTRLILPTGFWTIAYWMANVNPRFDVFLATLGCTLLAVLSGESYGLLCGALVMDFEKAMTVMIVFSLTAMAAGGFYVENIPSFLVWLKYVSPFKPGYEAAQMLVFDRNVPCDGSGALAEYCTEGVEYATPEQVLDVLNSEGTIAFNIGILVLLVIIPRYLAFLALKGKKGAERS